VYAAAHDAGASEQKAYQKAFAQIHGRLLLECDLGSAEKPLTARLRQ
jgi:hypothetical protein